MDLQNMLQNFEREECRGVGGREGFITDSVYSYLTRISCKSMYLSRLPQIFMSWFTYWPYCINHKLFVDASKVPQTFITLSFDLIYLLRLCVKKFVDDSN